MTAGDVPLGMSLKAAAGWNQTESDWRRFLALEPDGCFVAELAGRAVGTVTTCVFDRADGRGAVAWVAMVLVEPSARGRGIGTALLRHALDWLDGRGVASVRLDATPMGRPIYEKLGFERQFELARYEGTVASAPDVGTTCAVAAAAPTDIDGLIALDADVTGANRGKLLRALHADAPDQARVVHDEAGTVIGYSLARPGADAWQIGPCVGSARTDAALLAEALRRHVGEAVYVDVPVGHLPAVGMVEAAGLTVQRPFHRMCRGEPVFEDIPRLWAGSGPEKG